SWPASTPAVRGGGWLAHGRLRPLGRGTPPARALWRRVRCVSPRGAGLVAATTAVAAAHATWILVTGPPGPSPLRPSRHPSSVTPRPESSSPHFRRPPLGG